MKSRPILYKTEMVQAIYEGRKNLTRRTKKLEKVNVNPDWFRYDGTANFGDQVPSNRHYFELLDLEGNPREKYIHIDCPYGKIGDILWVRETFYISKYDDIKQECPYIYKASVFDADKLDLKWKPSIYMPQKACRLFLKITDIRCERLMDISEEDAKAEGVDFQFAEMFQEDRFKDYLDFNSDYRTAYSSFQSLWESINGVESFNANPWVWVIQFEKTEKPEGWPQ